MQPDSPSKNKKAMRLFQILQVLDSSITPNRCKLHMAGWNNIEDPLDVYLAGNFDAWQAEQSRGNFNRDLVVSLIALSDPNKWLFVGVHDVSGWSPIKHRIDNFRRYIMTRRASTDSMSGRLVVDFKRTGRQSYLCAENWEMSLLVAEIRAERLQVIDFPGYTKTMLSKQHLDIIVKQQNASWKSALSSVKGIYVIADKTNGKLYIGSATGEGGIWGRWCEYAKTGHGWNKELRKLLRKNGVRHADNFQFGVLETADSRATNEDILERESHWKELLLTRDFGYNAN